MSQQKRNQLEAIDDIAGPLPASVLREWMDGDRNPARAAQLLEPFRFEGTVASSDSSGLSKLTRSLGVIEITAAISRMKQVVHVLGLAAGGRAPGGPWVADNTEMVYNADVEMDQVLAAVLETHRRLPPDGLKLGYCIHYGDFYEIGGGLYGRDADLVELVAEEYAAGGETLITESAASHLRHRDLVELTRRSDLDNLGTIFRVDRGPKWTTVPPISARTLKYPHPFSDELYELLNALGGARTPEEAEAANFEIKSKFLCTRTVLLIETGTGAMAEPQDILDSMIVTAQAGKLIQDAVSRHAEVVTNNRGLLLITFEDGQEAIDAAREICGKLAASGKEARAGIDRGPVLLVPDKGGWQLIGGPVNIASKQAHELGQPGKIFVTFRATMGVHLPPPVHKYRAQISGVELEGVVLDLPSA